MANGQESCSSQDVRVKLNREMVTVFVEHNKVIAKVLKKYYRLTPTEFCILRAIYLSGGVVEGVDFASFLCLKRNSISAALARLEAQGLIGKSASKQDRRAIVVTETDRGTQVTREATGDIYGALVNSFWRNLEMDDKLGGNQTASLVLEALRGIPTTRTGGLKDTNTPISPEFIMFCKAVPQLWTKELARVGLALSEYRILDYVTESRRAVRSAEIARALFFERSAVSTLKDALMEKGLLRVVLAENDRVFDVGATPEGEALALHATMAMQRATNAAYALCDDGLVARINDWHLRMFANMNVLNAVI